MNEYRCTFPTRYPAGSLGHGDPSARQGYYIKAEIAAEAARIASKHFYEGEWIVDVQSDPHDPTHNRYYVADHIHHAELP